MKIKVLHRSAQENLPPTHGVARRFSNPNPALHPFERAREYQRALVAVKLQKIFAKPFVRAMDGHTDAVKCLAVARKAGAPLISGSCDGELRIWNLQHLKCGGSVLQAHEGFVRGVAVSPDTRHVLSCGDDKTAKMWTVNTLDCTLSEQPEFTYHAASIQNSIDHHWRRPMFVTASDTVNVWDYERSSPLSSFEWGCERVLTARFNPAEPALIASTAVDRSIGLYDLRGNSAIRKVILKMRSNAVCWNPMRPLFFTVANEDCNLYTFDMRKLEASLKNYWDHVMAVLDVCYSPSGQEFVSASYDQTVRLWHVDQAYSRDVYHGKRMARVLCCCYTPDGRFVLSGSEDTNIRVWKNKSDEKLGVLSVRERNANAYREALKEKFKKLPEIKRIRNRKHIPKMVKSLSEKRTIMRKAKTRKLQNVEKHSKPGSVKRVPLKKQHIIKELT